MIIFETPSTTVRQFACGKLCYCSRKKCTRKKIYIFFVYFPDTEPCFSPDTAASECNRYCSDTIGEYNKIPRQNMSLHS